MKYLRIAFLVLPIYFLTVTVVFVIKSATHSEQKNFYFAKAQEADFGGEVYGYWMNEYCKEYAEEQKTFNNWRKWLVVMPKLEMKPCWWKPEKKEEEPEIRQYVEGCEDENHFQIWTHVWFNGEIIFSASSYHGQYKCLTPSQVPKYKAKYYKKAETFIKKYKQVTQ